MQALALIIAGGCGARRHEPARVPDASVAEAGFDAASDAAPSCDQDGDGVYSGRCGGEDCDDTDPDVHPGAPDGPRWEVEEVADGAFSAALAIDGEGFAHIHFEHRDDPLYDFRYATNRDGAWAIETEEEVLNASWSSAIEVDPDGIVHVAYGAKWEGGDPRWGPVDETTWAVRYATRSAGTWEIETVDAPSPLGAGVDLALDDEGSAHVVYSAGDDCVDSCDLGLRYATNASGGGWVVSRVYDSFVESRGSLELDGSSTPVIAFVDRLNGFTAPDVRLAVLTGGAWDVQYVATTDGLAEYTGECCAALDLGADGTRLVSYGGGSLGLATLHEPGEWNRERIDAQGGDLDVSDLDTASNDAGMHIAYVLTSWPEGHSSYELRYAAGDPGSWTVETIDAWRDGFPPDAAIALDPAGGVHVAYSGSGWRLRYATRHPEDDTDWNCDGSELE